VPLTIACERLAQGADDRNAAADAGLEADRHSGLVGGPKKFLAMLGQQRLVAGDNIFARGECLQYQLAGRFDTAKQFDDNIYIGTGHQRGAIARD